MKRLSNCADVDPRNSSSRDAVESAIEISKGDKRMTWDRAASLLDKISAWDSTVSEERPSASEDAEEQTA
jgi:hypothetical protein